MPRPLRALLISIDAQFDVASYALRVPNAYNLLAMLDDLIDAGYVRTLADVKMETSDFVAPKAVPVSAPHEANNARALQDAIAEITEFVMQHLPQDALEICFSLESMSSAAQLQASLGLYIAKIEHLGGAATLHVTKVQRLLRHL